MPYIPHEYEHDWSEIARHDELMHQLEAEEAEKQRIEEEALLAEEDECPTCFGHGGCADCMNEDDIRFDDCAVPAC